MKVEYQRDFLNSYCLFPLKENLNETSYDYNLLTTQILRGFIPCVINQTEEIGSCTYNISGKISLKKYFYNKKITYKEFMWILEEIYRAIKEVQEHLGNDRWIVLEPEFIFMNMGGNSISFLLFPENISERSDIYYALKEFFSEQIDTNDEGTMDLLQWFSGVSIMENFSWEIVLEYGEKKEVSKIEPEETYEPLFPKTQDLSLEEDQNSIFSFLIRMPKGMIISCLFFLMIGILSIFYTLPGTLIPGALLGILSGMLYTSRNEKVKGKK